MPSVLITGAGSGIGRDTARLFARQGWRCVLVDHNGPALAAVLADLPVPTAGPHLARTTDLTDPEQVAALGQGLPALDAVINNAGMSDTSNTPLADQTPQQLARLLALNLAAPAAVVTACTPALRPGARVVNVSSGAGLHAIPWRGAYSPSKAGLIAQTQALAQAQPNWCPTVLAPGFVRTDLVDSLIQAGRLNPQNAVAKIPLGRMAAPAEMAHALWFLASAGAAPLRGQVLAVNGGSSVYGGSQPLPPCPLAPLPWDTPMAWSVVGGDPAPWLGVAPAPAPAAAYPAVLDLSACLAPPGGLLAAVHAAAARFAAQHTQQASLTLLWPAAAPETGPWQAAGDRAAARMLVSTLACEWGARALRINALEWPAGAPVGAPVAATAQLHPLMRYVAGAAAQYLTGQTLVCQTPAKGEAA